MGEWSDFFEDFPEENPANYVNGQFNPEAAKRINEQNARLREQQEKANTEINALIKKAKSEAKRKAFIDLEGCVQCGETKLSIYKFRDDFYSCECEACGIYGEGKTQSASIEKAKERIGDFLDWRDKKGF